MNMSTNKVNVDSTFDGENGSARSLPEKDSSQQRKKPFILKRISNAIINNMENGFYWVGNLIGTHPWKAVLLSLFVVGIFSAGVANFKESSDRDTLWVPSDSSVYKYKNWVDANFETTTHFVSVIFVDSNILTPSLLQAMYQFYDRVQSLTTSQGKNITDLCVMSGTNCFVTSIMELWSYVESDINAASLSDIKTKIKTTTTSPMYYTDFEATSVLGGITYSSGDVDTARAAKITWLLKADSANEDDSLEWEKLAIDLALKGQSGIDDVYVTATRSFGDVGGETIQGDITLLSAGYMIVIVFVIVILGRFNWLDFGLGMAVCGIMVIGVSIGFSFGLASAAGWLYTPLHSVLPFLLLGIGVDDLFVVVAAYKNVPTEFQNKPVKERIAMTLKHAGVSITVTSLTDMCAFGVGATTVLPALRSFCVFCCLGILALYLLSVTFFVACVALNAKRTDANRNSLICCYSHKPEYRRNECSKREIIALVFKKYFGPFLVKLPVKIATMCVTVILLGIGTWGFVVLKQEFDPIWFLPTDSYPYKFDEMNDKYFTSTGESGAVYCKDLDYYNSKTKFETLYTEMTNANFVSSGSVDSWFRSFTSYLSTATAASVTSKIDGTTKYPTSDQNFHDLLDDYTTTQAEGKRHASQLKLLGTSPNLDLTASYITFKHTIFKTSTEKINGMEDMMKLVANIFPNDDCFPYSREYLSWYTNKVIQAELYRNLGIAAVCVFLVCLILIANIVTSLMVFACVVFTLLDVGGMMNFWGLTIDTVTSIILILAIGLAVDYSAHIGHCFMTFTGDRNNRVKATLVEMGAPVFSGGFSTFLAFILLAGSNSYVFTTFFKVFLLVVVFGLFHGLVFLPTILSWLGPAPYDTAHRENHPPEDVEIDIKSPSSHKSNNLQGVDNLAMNNKEDKVRTTTPPPKYERPHSNQPYNPPPDYTPPTPQKSTNGSRITPVDT